MDGGVECCTGGLEALVCAFFFVLVRPMKVVGQGDILGSHERDEFISAAIVSFLSMIANPTTSSVFEYETHASEASKDVLFLERLDTFMEKCLGDIKAFAERELRPYEEVF